MDKPADDPAGLSQSPTSPRSLGRIASKRPAWMEKAGGRENDTVHSPAFQNSRSDESVTGNISTSTSASTPLNTSNSAHPSSTSTANSAHSSDSANTSVTYGNAVPYSSPYSSPITSGASAAYSPRGSTGPPPPPSFPIDIPLNSSTSSVSSSSLISSPPSTPSSGFLIPSPRSSMVVGKRGSTKDFLTRKQIQSVGPQSPVISPIGSPINSPLHSPRQSEEVIWEAGNGMRFVRRDITNGDTEVATSPLRQSNLFASSTIMVASSLPTGNKTKGGKAPRTEGTVDLAGLLTMDEERFNMEFFNYPEANIDFTVHNQTRDKVAHEFLTTERTYNRSLTICLHLWGPLMLDSISSKPFRELVKKTLLSIEDILRVNMELFEQLQHKFENWSDTQTIGDVLFIITPFLKMYQNYTTTHDEITQKLQKLHEKEYKEKKFQAMMTTLESHPVSKSATLGSFLILPVQRIPRYVLLLTDLLKFTPETHPDFNSLQRSLNSTKAVATIINEAMDVADMKRKVLTVQRLFGDNVEIVASHRTLVLEGSLKKQCRKDKKTRSDMLIYARPNTSTAAATGKAQPKLLVSGQLLLEKTKVVDVSETDSIQLQSPGKSIQLYFEPGEKEVWFREISNTIQQHNTNLKNFQLTQDSDLGVAPVWSPDDNFKACPLCKAKFTTIHRRHHCRKCGTVVCGDCSGRKLLVPEVKVKKKCRVCDRCFSEAQK